MKEPDFLDELIDKRTKANPLFRVLLEAAAARRLTAREAQGVWVGMPKGWPLRFNACTEPCDMLVGPCCCGAHHTKEEAVAWIDSVSLP